MASGPDAGSQDSTPVSSGEHPADICTCGHIRSLHGPHPTGGDCHTTMCLAPNPDTSPDADPYADLCLQFELAKTALAVAVENVTVCTGANNEHRPYALNVDDDEDCPLCIGLAQRKAKDFQLLGGCEACGHDEPHDGGGIGVCAADRCGCDGPSRCEECGHAEELHADDGCTATVGCDCKAGALVPEPEMPLVSVNPLPAYRVQYAVTGGQLYTIIVPGDAAVKAEDGILKVFHPERYVLGIACVETFPELKPQGEQ